MASNKTCRWIAVSALVAAAAAGPVVAATTSPAPQQQAYPGKCLAWFGNQEDGKCLGYSNGQPISGGTPSFGIGPNGNGIGVSTGPLAPGTTWTNGVN